MFSSKSFIVSGLTVKSLIHFEFIFMYGIRKCSSSILLHVTVQFSQHHLLKRMSFLHCIFLPPLSKIRCPQVCGFIFRLSISFQWFIFLFFCQYHTVLRTVALQYSLKSGRLILPTPFFFLKIALAIWGLLCLHTNCELFCSSSVKNTLGSLIGIVLHLQITLGSIVIFSLLWGHCSFLLEPGAECSVCALQESISQSCVSSDSSMVGLIVISSKRAYAIPQSAASRASAPVTDH